MLKFLSNRRVRIVLLAGLGGLLGLLLVAALWPRQLLCIDSGNVTGDVIVLLGGDTFGRPVRVAELYRDRAAAKILICGQGDWGSNRAKLIQAGVPQQSIFLEPDSTSTRQNAQFSIPLLRSVGARRVILVTTWFHSRRALRVFQHDAPDIQFYSRPSYWGFSRAEWSLHHISNHVRVEYGKLLGYWVLYGICPL
jgi:uncharacterized SAM-binding protein YcdF (DUF218 family)